MNRDEIEKIAALARIRIADGEVEEVARRLSAILEMVGRIQAVDTTGVEPLSNPLDACQRLRPDEVTETGGRDGFQAIAPAVEADLYLVPKVIE